MDGLLFQLFRILNIWIVFTIPLIDKFRKRKNAAKDEKMVISEGTDAIRETGRNSSLKLISYNVKLII